MVSILFLCFYSWTEDLRQGWKSNLERNGCDLSNPRFTTKPFLFSMKIVLCAVVYLLRRSGWFKLCHTSRRFIVPQTISDISCYSPCKNIKKLLDRWSPVEIGNLSSLSNPEDILCESLRRLLSFLLKSCLYCLHRIPRLFSEAIFSPVDKQSPVSPLPLLWAPDCLKSRSPDWCPDKIAPLNLVYKNSSLWVKLFSRWLYPYECKFSSVGLQHFTRC